MEKLSTRILQTIPDLKKHYHVILLCDCFLDIFSSLISHEIIVIGGNLKLVGENHFFTDKIKTFYNVFLAF